MRDDLNNRFDELAPMYFLYERGTNHSKHASAVFREKFLNNEPIVDERSLLGLNAVKLK